jgi:hypothetical protein
MKFTTLSATIVVVFLLVGIVMVPPQENHAAPTPSGWIDIMPGPSLNNWTRVAFPPSRPLPSHSQWSVDTATHTLVCAGNGGHEWLRYDKELRNFLFHVEWRLTPHKAGKGYNSGVFVRNDRNGNIWYQAQVGDAGGGYWFGNNPEGKELKRFSLHSQMTTNPVKHAGEWNTFDIRCQGAKIILKVNGTKASEFDKCKNLKGYLGLEAEGSRIEFRQMRIKILK